MGIVNCGLDYMILSWAICLGTSDLSSFRILSQPTPYSLENYLPFSSWRMYAVSIIVELWWQESRAGYWMFQLYQTMVIYSTHTVLNYYSYLPEQKSYHLPFPEYKTFFFFGVWERLPLNYAESRRENWGLIAF